MRVFRRCVAVFVVALVAVVVVAVTMKSTTAGSTDPTGEPTAQTAQTAANGRLPQDDLALICEGHALRRDAATAFESLRSAAADAGVTWTINSAYRDYDTQLQMVEKYGLLADGGRAAPPGESDHGLGLSVDLTLDWDEVEWMRAHAAAHGFVETIADEPWHWTYRP
ncbi:M15 family metallopeptidase [Sanguibacter sp. A247]|uniref:M15 family metallopeptidase n=1 Tax=unclassified Sanguibacter TaxID=2645534 RepID=UPI003FD819FB